MQEADLLRMKVPLAVARLDKSLGQLMQRFGLIRNAWQQPGSIFVGSLMTLARRSDLRRPVEHGEIKASHSLASCARPPALPPAWPGLCYAFGSS